ncbi:MAG: serine/threonine-protein phosphatase [Bacteroidales bacterium]|nr:serine/threonine-protein phosphatase [Bacteroidales bacterium]
MKKALTARWGILILLALFGLLIAASTVLAVRISREVCLVKEYDSLMDDLKIIAGVVSEYMDENDPDSFEFIEVAARIQENEENFSYVLRDSSGIVLAPSFASGKPLKLKNIRMLRDDGTAFMADIWGARCFIVRYAFPDRPLELVGIYDDQYVFSDLRHTVKMFIGIISVVFLVLLAAAWFWIIPALERVLSRKRQAENELQIAHDLQQKALTKAFPDDARCQVHAVLQPARQVGGDIYRCRVIGDKLYFAIGDVSDKGMAAAYVMFMLSSIIKSRADHGDSTDSLMREINELLLDNAEYEMLCTVFLGIIDLDTLEMEYCNAGHTKTILNGTFLDQDPQLLAGVVRDYPYHAQKLKLSRGSRLLLYTDGVTEARDESLAFFGERRLLEWMSAQDPADSCEKTCEKLFDTLTAFRGKAEQNDDIAIMCIKI